jgi:hypothetical protein
MLSRSSVKKSTSPAVHSTAVANLDVLFPLAIATETRPSRKTREVETIRRFDVPMPVGAEVVRVRILAKTYVDPQEGTRIYTVEAIEIEPPKPGSADRGSTGAGALDQAASSPETPQVPAERPETTFAQMVEVVKGTDILYQGEPFYSRLQRAVEDSKTNRASGAQWKATIKNAKIGINQDEYVFAHVDDLADGTAYTKQEVLDYLKANELRVVPVVLGGTADEDSRTNEDLEVLLHEHGYAAELDPRGDEDPLVLVNSNGEPLDIEDQGTDFPEEVIDAFNVLNRRHLEPRADDTRYANWQEKGADEGSYREVFLTAPPPPLGPNDPNRKRLQQDQRSLSDEFANNHHWMTPERLRTDGDEYRRRRARQAFITTRLLEIQKALGQSARWQDGHGEYDDIHNPIVRVRFNVRSTPSYTRAQYHDIGERIRQAIGAKSFDSIASGGPDAAVRKGAITPLEAAQFSQEAGFYLNDQTGAVRRVMFLEEVQPPHPEEQKKMPPLLAKHWRELAFKWALRYAAQNGLDGVAWTSGQMQADRYSLEQHVKSIKWGPVTEGGPSAQQGAQQFVVIDPATAGQGAHIRLTLDGDGKVLKATALRDARFEGRHIADVVGKEVADRITSNHVGSLEGEGLKIGGQGLKKLYDVDFPNVVNNLPAVKRAGVRVRAIRHNKTPHYAVQFRGNSGYYVVNRSVSGSPRVAGPFGYQDEAEAHIDQVLDARKVEVPGLDITPALRDVVMGGQPMFQGAQGATEFTLDGKAIIRGFASANFSTAAHELFHVARRQRLNRLVPLEQRGGITDADIDTFEQWAGVGADGVWTVDAEEKAARGFERHLRDGATFANEAVQKVFDAIKQWMVDIYAQLAGSDIDVDISPEVRAIFDKLIGAEVREALAADKYHATQRGVAWADMTDAELRELFTDGIGDEPSLAARELKRRQEVVEKDQKIAVRELPKGQRSDWEVVGKNVIGQTLYQDQRGVRSYIENGVRQTGR